MVPLLLLLFIDCIHGQSQKITPVGEMGQLPAGATPVGQQGGPTPIGQIGGQGAGQAAGTANMEQLMALLAGLNTQVQFTPSPIDNWLASKGYGVGSTVQVSPSPLCKPVWRFGCEPWHNTMPTLWRSSIAPYNPQYNYRDWRAHVRPNDIPRLTAYLSRLVNGGGGGGFGGGMSGAFGGGGGFGFGLGAALMFQ